MTDDVKNVPTSKNLEDRERGRRALIKALGAGAGAVVLGSKWSKPIVDSVVVPLHAQMSAPGVFAIGCVGDPESGSDVAQGAPISVTVTLLRSEGAGPQEPFVGGDITGRITCDGAEIFNGSIGSTDALGRVEHTFNNDCEPGERVEFEATFNVPPEDQPPSEVSTDPEESCFWITEEEECTLECESDPEAGSDVCEEDQISATITLECGGAPLAGEAVTVRLLCNGNDVGNRNIFPFNDVTDANGQVQLDFSADPSCPFGQRITLDVSVPSKQLSDDGCWWLKVRDCGGEEVS